MAPSLGGVLSCRGRDHPVPGQRGATLVRGHGAPALQCAALPASSTGKVGETERVLGKQFS